MGYIRVLLYLPGPAESPGAAMITGGGNREDVPFEEVNVTEEEAVNVTVVEVVPVQVIGLMFSSGGSGSIAQTPDKIRNRKNIADNILQLKNNTIVIQ